MKNRSKLLLLGCSLCTVLAACTKKASNPYYADGTAPVLGASSTSIAPVPADSLSNAVVFTWTDPKYPTPAPGATLYTIQIDSSGRGFAKAVSMSVSGVLTDSLTAKQLNTILLGFGFNFNVQYSVDVRVISSYSNNNDQILSNTLTLQVTPYKIPPKVPLPTGSLYLVGSATQGGWNNPVPVPTQQLEEIDSADFGGVFNLIGGGAYLILPLNGDWTNKYATNDASPASTGGTFGYNASNNFNGPATSGWYSIVMSFQTGTITVTPYSGTVPAKLYIVGDATPGGWTNPVPVPSQQMTQLNSSQFSVTLPITGGKGYLFLPLNGDWTNKYAVGGTDAAATGGTFGYNLSNNFTGPATSGTYTITADFLSWKYKVTQ